MSLLICTPMYGGVCTAGYFRSCIDLETVLTTLKIQHDWLTTANESLITRGRNTSASTFLKGEWSRLFFIDADIEFKAEDVSALWNMDADVAVGCYPRKELKAQYAAWHRGKILKAHDMDKIQNPFPVDYAGTGFMMIKRRVFELLKIAHPEWLYREGHVGESWAFFQDPIEEVNGERIHLSEDYFFCKRVRELGLDVMMHPNVRLKHWGSHCFDGT